LPLLRVYFYHAPPAKDSITNPLDKRHIDLSGAPVFSKNKRVRSSVRLRIE
jgi:hypothetical protein